MFYAKRPEVKSVVQVHHFLLSCIYIMEKVIRDDLVKLVESTTGFDKTKSTALVAGAISILLKNGEISLSPKGYKLTRLGERKFRKKDYSSSTSNYKYEKLDEIRIAVMNANNRNKKLRI